MKAKKMFKVLSKVYPGLRKIVRVRNDVLLHLKSGTTWLYKDLRITHDIEWSYGMRQYPTDTKKHNIPKIVNSNGIKEVICINCGPPYAIMDVKYKCPGCGDAIEFKGEEK